MRSASLQEAIFRRWSDPQLMRTASGVQLEIPWLSSNPAAGLRVLANFDSGMQRFESCRPSLPVGSPPRGAAAGKELRSRHCASHGLASCHRIGDLSPRMRDVASANGRFSRPIVLRRHVWRSRSENSRWITPAALIRILPTRYRCVGQRKAFAMC